MSTAELWAAAPEPSLWGESEPQAVSLYPWQEEAVERLRANIRARVLAQILAAPTGAGKTVMGTHLLHECYSKGKRGIFVCDRIPLIEQTSRTLDKYGIPHGVIQADHWRNQPNQRIQVASVKTLEERGWPAADLIIVDEAHSLYKVTTERILQGDCKIVGLSATPFTRGLGKIYGAVVTVRTTRQLINEGFLCDFDVYAHREPDMSGATTAAGEWTKEAARERSMPIVGDVVTEYLRHAAGRKFICFGVDTKHCAELQRQFMAAGVVCGLYTYRTTDTERAELLRQFERRDGYLQGLVSVAALSKGFDNPGVEVVILARPLRNSFAEHIQMLGRGLRRDPDNPEKRCIVLDHAGNCVRFWRQMHEFLEYGVRGLDDGRKKEAAERKEPRAKDPVKCPRCAHVHMPAPMCSRCGHEYPRRSEVAHVAGELSKLTGLPAGSGADRQAFYSQLLGIARERGYSPGWANFRFVERFGAKPAGLEPVEAEPTREVANWVRRSMIAFSRGKGRGR